jgi:hypothetical protein
MRVFLGGTVDSHWRELLIPMLQCDYFNPIVKNWTPAHMQEELHQRSICEYTLYTLTPLMTGVYSVAECVDDSNKKPDTTILVIIYSDYGKQFSASQIASLEQLSRMVQNNGSHVFTTLSDAAAFLNQRNEEYDA